LRGFSERGAHLGDVAPLCVFWCTLGRGARLRFSCTLRSKTQKHTKVLTSPAPPPRCVCPLVPQQSAKVPCGQVRPWCRRHEALHHHCFLRHAADHLGMQRGGARPWPLCLPPGGPQEGEASPFPATSFLHHRAHYAPRARNTFRVTRHSYKWPVLSLVCRKNFL